MTLRVLRAVAVLGPLTLGSVALAHELIYLLVHGTAGYDAAMDAGGHGRYWSTFVLVAGVVLTTLGIAGWLQLRRLRALAREVDAGAVRVVDARWSRLGAVLFRLYPRLALGTTLMYTAQETLETSAAGAPLPGLGPLVGEQAIALPVLLLVSLAVALVGALFRWRRDVLLARIGASVTQARRAPGLATPRGDVNRPAGNPGLSNGAVRAPPLNAAAC